MSRHFMAFTAQQMARLAHITERQLRYWEQTRAYRPTYVEQHDRGPFRRIYSFQDLVNLRTIARLRDLVSLDELRRVGAYLHQYSDQPWSGLAVRVYGNHLAFRDPRSGTWMSGEPLGQLVLTLELEDVSAESEGDVHQAMTRSPEDYGRITRNRNIMSNAWVFAGTRIPIEAVMSLHQSGMSPEATIAQYPTLVPADIEAALAHRELAA